ncbi:MAG: alpha-hydroxy acid oxidase [Nocardioidaceae bacterium]
MIPERYADRVELLAAEQLPEAVHRYVRQGAREGTSVGEASAAWDRHRFLPRVLRDVTEVDLRTTLLGTALSSPFAVAPTAMQSAVHAQGEAGMAQGVADAGSLVVVSSNAGSTYEAIGATGAPWWAQVYVTADRPACLPLLERAVSAGARAIVVTADTPVVGTKYDGGAETVWDLLEPGWLQTNFPPGYGEGAGDAKATDLGPQDVEWLGRVTGLPVVVKGVLRGDDARRCLDAGAAAVWVSNHGGRQLDQAAATADCLAAVVSEVGDAVEVYVDGGVRTGRHALAALALGARAVFLGRPPVYALAVDGPAGVTRLFEELADELAETLRLVGCSSVGSVTGDLLSRSTPADGGARE